jgi:hypothetical protein
MRRTKLGKVKAKMKAAPQAEVPKQEKNKTSRIRPSTRDPMVSKPTKETLRKLFSMSAFLALATS